MKNKEDSNMNYIECGQIVSTHGVRGELRVNPWSDSPDFLLQFKRFYLKDGTPLAVEFSRVHKNCVNVKFENIRSIDDAMPYIHKTLYLDREDVTLPEGSYFIADLIGLAVSDVDTGKAYGKIVDVFRTGANDVYTIRDDAGKEVLVPALKEVVIETDILHGSMKIRPLKGLFDE